MTNTLLSEPNDDLEVTNVALRLSAIEIETLTHERDMLARRCAEQAHKIAELLAPTPKAEPQAPVFSAVETMNRQGIH